MKNVYNMAGFMSFDFTFLEILALYFIVVEILKFSTFPLFLDILLISFQIIEISFNIRIRP